MNLKKMMKKNSNHHNIFPKVLMIRENIRKKWLKLTIFRAFIKLSSFLIIIAACLFGTSDANARIFRTLSVLLFAGVFGFFFASIGAYVFYQCAYKKPGTALLTFSIFCYFLYIPSALLKIIQNLQVIHGNVIFAKTNPEPLWLSVFLICVFTYFIFIDLFEYYWVYYGLKLRSANKELQGENLRKMPEFHQIIVSMENATSIDQLNTVYSAEVRKFPQISWYLTKLFKKLQEQLKMKG